MFDAIIVNPGDNVATALRDLAPGSVTTNRGEFRLLTQVASGHKFAIADIPSGQLVVKYGSAIGAATSGIRTGTHLHVHNVGDILRVSDGGATERVHPPVPDRPDDPRVPSWDVEALRQLTFNGYPRADGRVGVRNHVVVVSTVGCANAVADRIAGQAEIAAITHQQGCLQLGDDLKLTRKQLNHVAGSPNVGGVLFVGLGCEANQAAALMSKLGDKPVEAITIQGEGGTRKAVERGIQIVEQMKGELSTRTESPSQHQQARGWNQVWRLRRFQRSDRESGHRSCRRYAC